MVQVGVGWSQEKSVGKSGGKLMMSAPTKAKSEERQTDARRSGIDQGRGTTAISAEGVGV